MSYTRHIIRVHVINIYLCKHYGIRDTPCQVPTINPASSGHLQPAEYLGTPDDYNFRNYFVMHTILFIYNI